MGNAVEGVNSPFQWALRYNPGQEITFPVLSIAGTSSDKRYIFAMGKGLIGSQVNGQPGYVVRGWFSIPKRYRKQRQDDQFEFVIENNTANDINVCELFIYKWYK